RFEFTNVVCESFDKPFGEFGQCFLKSVNRSYKYLTVSLKLNQLPITKIKASLVLWKRFSGYKPFLYNITIDFCKFVKNRKSNPVANFFFETYQNYSNANHTCPYNHDLIVDKLNVNIMNHRLTEVLPFPHGDYMAELIWYRADFHRLVVKVYCTL
ncbi:hypothetical protein KR009_011448, partial [Drosophila setifemur]